MNKNYYTILILLIINTPILAGEKRNYDFNELSYGSSGSSLNHNRILTYNHSHSFSDRFYLTAGLTQSSSSNVVDPSFFTKAEIGFGSHKQITDITDIYLEFSYSNYWLHNLENKLAIISMKSGSITDISNNIQLITEVSFNKFLQKNNNDLTYFNRRPKDIEFEISGLFELKNKNQFILGASSNKGFPYFGFKFK